MGFSSIGRLLVISHSERGETIRIISARPATPRERKRHENKKKNNRDELRPEYDFDYSKGVRGKYHKRLSEEGANVVVLQPDVAKAFSASAAVNKALRSLLNLTPQPNA